MLIAIARALASLKIAAKVDKADRDYFRQTVEPLRLGVEFVGEINEREKASFSARRSRSCFRSSGRSRSGGDDRSHGLRNARARLRPRLGSEIVEDGVTGRVVASVDEALTAFSDVVRLNRRTVRKRFEQRFSARRMARDYVRVYASLLQHETTHEEDGSNT